MKLIGVQPNTTRAEKILTEYCIKPDFFTVLSTKTDASAQSLKTAQRTGQH